MSEPEYYRLKAADCAQLAEKATIQAHRDAFMRAAEAWILLAELFEGPPRPDRVPVHHLNSGGESSE
jgi:hypothetical protein